MSRSPTGRKSALDDGGPSWMPTDPYPPPKRSPVTHSFPKKAQKPGPDDPIPTHSKSRRKDWDTECTWVRWSLDPNLGDLAPLKLKDPQQRKRSPPRRKVRRKRRKDRGDGAKNRNASKNSPSAAGPVNAADAAAGPAVVSSASEGGNHAMAPDGSGSGIGSTGPAKRKSMASGATQTPRHAACQTSLPGSSEDEDPYAGHDDYYSASDDGAGAAGAYGSADPREPEAAAFVEGLLRYEKQGAEQGARPGDLGSDGLAGAGDDAAGRARGVDPLHASPQGPEGSSRAPMTEEGLLEASLALKRSDDLCASAVGAEDGRRVVVFLTASADLDRLVAQCEKEVWPEVNRYCRQRGDLRFAVEVVPVTVPDELSVQPGSQLLRLRTMSRCLPLFVTVLGEDYGATAAAGADEPVHRDVVEQYPWLAGRTGVSLTDMEASAAMRHAEAAPSPGTIAYLVKTEPRGINEQRPRGARRMTELRDRVAASQMRVLEASSSQAVVKQMAEEVIGAINREFPRLADVRRIMPITVTRDTHEGFASAAGAVTVPVPKTAVISQLSAYINSKDGMAGTPLVIASEFSSPGATTAITSWIAQSRHFTRPDEMVFRFVHFCGAGTTSGVNSLVYRLVRELRQFLNEEMVLGSMDPVEFGRELPALFQTLHKAGMAAIIVIDGLGSLTTALHDPAAQGAAESVIEPAAAPDATDAQSPGRAKTAVAASKLALSAGALDWLPETLPDGVKVVLSVGTDPELQFEVKRRHWPVLTLPAFTEEESAGLLMSLQRTPGGALVDDDVRFLMMGADARPSTRANPLFLQVAAALLRDPYREVDVEDIVQADETGTLYAYVLQALEARAPPGFPSITSDVLSVLQLSVHGMSKCELLHVLGIPRSLFDAHFGPYEAVLFLQVSAEGVQPHEARRVTLFCDILRRLVRSRYLATPALTRHARMLLVEHFEGFIGPGTLERLPTLEEVITCSRDGDFARSAHELAWALIREEAWDYVGQLIGNLAVFRTLWSSDVRRDVYLMWVTLQRHVDPVDIYFEPILDLFWTTTDDSGRQDLTRTLPLARLAADVGELFLLLGNPAAVRLISLAIELYKKLHGSDQHPDVARCHYMLGYLHRADRATLLESISAFESSYNIYARTLGNHIGAVDALVSLGEVLIMQGAVNEALEALRLAKKMLEDMGVSDFHPQSARCFNNMGLIAKKTGQLSASDAYYKKALAIRVEAYGENHPHTAVTLRNLGSLAFSMQKRDAAVSHFTRALKISENVFGPMHSTTAATHEWLGGILQEMGNETEGKVHAAKAAFIREKVRALASKARENAAVRSERYSSQEVDPKVVALPRPSRDPAQQQGGTSSSSGSAQPGDTIGGAVVNV